MLFRRRQRSSWKQQRVLLAGYVSLVVAIVSLPAWAVEPYSMTPVQLQPGPDLPAAIAAVLDPHGVHVFTYQNGQPTPICDVFMAKSASSQETPERTNKVIYSQLKAGALVAVIHFLPESSEDYREDFHDQKLKPGYYTMRYAVMREGESSDFVLLSPVSEDRNPDHVPAPDELVRMSLKASETEDPAVMSLVAVSKTDKAFPDVLMADDGSCVLQFKLQMKSAKGNAEEPLALAMIVATPPEEEGGSSD